MRKPTKLRIYLYSLCLLWCITVAILDLFADKFVFAAIWLVTSALFALVLTLAIRTYQTNCRTYELVQRHWRDRP